jgi:hypothetical protein
MVLIAKTTIAPCPCYLGRVEYLEVPVVQYKCRQQGNRQLARQKTKTRQHNTTQPSNAKTTTTQRQRQCKRKTKTKTSKSAVVGEASFCRACTVYRGYGHTSTFCLRTKTSINQSRNASQPASQPHRHVLDVEAVGHAEAATRALVQQAVVATRALVQRAVVAGERGVDALAGASEAGASRLARVRLARVTLVRVTPVPLTSVQAAPLLRRGCQSRAARLRQRCARRSGPHEL